MTTLAGILVFATFVRNFSWSLRAFATSSTFSSVGMAASPRVLFATFQIFACFLYSNILLVSSLALAKSSSDSGGGQTQCPPTQVPCRSAKISQFDEFRTVDSHLRVPL